VRRLLAFQLFQGTLANLASLDGRFTVLGEVLTGRGIVVQTVVHFGDASAHYKVCQSPVGHEKAGNKFRGLFAGGSAETDFAKDGTAIISGALLRNK